MIEQPPLTFFIGLFVNNFGATAACAMIMLVLWQSTRERTNQLLAAYAAVILLWGMGGNAMRMNILLGQQPYMLFYVNALMAGLSGLFLFWLTVHMAGLWSELWVKWASIVALPLFAGMIIYRLVAGTEGITFLPDGRFTVQMGLLGQLAVATLYVYYFLALVILWRHRHKGTGNLVFGGTVAVVGLSASVISPAVQAIMPPIGPVAFSTLFFARAVMNENLFNPLRQMNDRLQKSEARYRALSELTSDYAYGVSFAEDGRMHIDWVTDAFTRTTGFTAADLEAEGDWKMIVHPDDADHVAEMEARLLTGAEIVDEYRVVTKGFETIWVREHRRPTLNENGRLVSLVGSAENISERKEIESKLQDSEMKYRLLLNNVRLPVLALEPDMTIFYCNKDYADFVGMTPEEMEGENLLELFPDTRRLKTYQVYQDVLHTGERRQVEGKMGDRILLAQIFPAPWGLLSVSNDITDRKIAEEAIAMNRMKTELLAKVSHELRTPLGAVLGYAEMLHEGARGPLNERQDDMMARIIVNTEKLIDNVNALLNEAQIELGTLKLKPTAFPPQQLLRNMHAVLDLQAQAKRLRFTSEVDGRMPPTIFADLQRVQQVLVNLAGNALKFTEEGWVHVRLAYENDNFWRIEVSDSGIGISETAQRYIFDAFRQADGSRTREHDGVGLGLSIVKQLVTLMGGTIVVESALDQGSTFSVLLPLTIPEGEKELVA